MEGMRVALISYEFPPAVAIGGIGTYAGEAARMLAKGGIEVEVFAAGPRQEEPATDHAIQVHRVLAEGRDAFREAILPTFRERHAASPFDLMESPEIGREGEAIAQAFPEIARVVKLHTPSYLVREFTYEPPTCGQQMRFTLGAIRRGRWQTLPKPSSYMAEDDPECHWTRGADEVVAPSRAIGNRLTSDWSLMQDRVSFFPNCYAPGNDLLGLTLPKSAHAIGFLGRLEPRKGILELAEAIPQVLRQYPTAHFRLMGPNWPFRGADMITWMKRRLGPAQSAVTFVGAVAPDDLAAELSQCDAIVLPSRWENFPFACWESMAAGRAVIGSAAGGMADIIEPGQSGLLIPPRDPRAMAQTILDLLGDVEQVQTLGAAGRERIRALLAPERVLPRQLASYERALERARRRLSIQKGSS